MNVIEIENLTKYYGKIKGVEDLTFSVKKGEIFGFLGPNGAGKTTTIRTLLGYLHPTRGSAKIFGKSIEDDPPLSVFREDELTDVVGIGK